MTEWQQLDPSNCPALVGTHLDDSNDTQRVAERISGNMLRVDDLKDGLSLSSKSYVGRIHLGELKITIRPKLDKSSLLRLLRYAFDLRRLKLISHTEHAVDELEFEDLLVSQLNAEARELISRGLQKSYIRRTDHLASPRGRININQIAMTSSTLTASPPCDYHPRTLDTEVNKTLLAGLHLAATITSQIDLKRDARMLVKVLEDQVSTIPFSASLLVGAERSLNRLTESYGPALTIIRLLAEAQGIVLEGKNTTSRIPGFLFDMNHFFQSLLSRFLREHLDGYHVRDEQGLQQMMRYNPDYNPRNQYSPTPRPDYAVAKGHRVVSLLDAKYRDLWEKQLPTNMPYQLVVYAISQRDNPQSTILYPTTNPIAKESRIDVFDPVYGRKLGRCVCGRCTSIIWTSYLGLIPRQPDGSVLERRRNWRLVRYSAKYPATAPRVL